MNHSVHIRSNMTFWVTALFFLIPVVKSFPQSTLCESLEFERESSVLTKTTKDKLDQLCKKTLTTKHGQIGLTVWQNDITESKPKTTLVESRMRKVFEYLIAKNCGALVSEIKIKPLQTDSIMRTGTASQENQIEVCLLEKIGRAHV